MNKPEHKAIAIVGMGAVMPDAPTLAQFWENIKTSKYSISEVPKNRWDADMYFDPDRKAMDKTYSKIGGWVKEYNWDPIKWKLPIPPKVADQMDFTQKWAISAAREALFDFGYPDKDFDKDRTAVILGVAMGGDQHLYSATRIFFPEYANILNKSAHFSKLDSKTRATILAEMHKGLDGFFPPITEDTMPGELSNIVAGRIAALFNFHGPNFIADAACASAMAGMQAAMEGLEQYDYDVVVTGGIDANMAPTTFVKFCKIGALSATGTRPYAEGADGFVMGEGGAIMILKRLEDAERDGDKIYAVIRSFGGSSDGRGKGITAPNPVGQRFAVKRAWENAGVSPATVTLIEGHGTSTSVGDAVELQCLHDVFGELNLQVGSIALGSVKSNIGHLKGAAGAAGMVKAAMALHEKVLPPSLNYKKPNPNVDFTKSPFRVNTELRPWEVKNSQPRRCGVSAFGFGGTNFHAVMEEYIPGKITSEQKTTVAFKDIPETREVAPKKPLRGAFVRGNTSLDQLYKDLEKAKNKITNTVEQTPRIPSKKDLESPIRIAIEYGTSAELEDKIGRVLKAIKADNKGMWAALQAKGIFLGKKKKSKTAFLFTGQGSQYINMLKDLREVEPIIKKTFAEADAVMTPLLGRSLSSYIFFDDLSKEEKMEANQALMQTEITQPAVLTVDIALFRLMKAYGITPDFVIGHSLGEYGALVAAGAITFADALKAVSARGSEMANVKVEDKGIMAAIFTSPDNINRILDTIDGYVVIANINSYGQSVIGGASKPVQEAMKACKEAGYHVAQLPVSHAFHTQIVAPASKPLANVLGRYNLKTPKIPVIANITGDFYPGGSDNSSQMIKYLAEQVASPVQFVKGISTLYQSGVRVFAEMGPKKALHGFVRDILSEKEDVLNLFTNHPKVGDISSFNQGLCGMYAAGYGMYEDVILPSTQSLERPDPSSVAVSQSYTPSAQTSQPVAYQKPMVSPTDDRYERLGRLFVDFMEKANDALRGEHQSLKAQEIYISGASIGLPGVDRVFQDSNIEKLLSGQQFISSIPQAFQQAMVDKNIIRLVKTGKGGPRFETISKIDEVIKLAGRKVNLDIGRDFGFPEERLPAIDTMTELAIGAGIDALRDAGIPLIMHYKTTTTGSKLPERWLLPDSMKDDTGIIFASAFPGYNAYAKEMADFYEDRIKRTNLDTIIALKKELSAKNGYQNQIAEIDTIIRRLEGEIKENPYTFNRRFLLRVLAMGHSQFAEYIGARGPNTQINSACASTTFALGMAKDWIDTGRCNRVIIIAGDDITSDETLAWFESGFLAVGAAATDARIEDAALPFDRRRHGMIVGMGGASIVVESQDSIQERGIQPIAQVLSTAMANSAFHGTQLDPDHISRIMEKLISEAEIKWSIDRYKIAPQTVFVSHETYTPARGGSAQAEVNALRYVFKAAADQIVVANTKGMTGHTMAVGIEDVLAIKSIETGWVPPVPNFKEIDPDLGQLNLSKGGNYPVNYALRLGAGFGSQISMSLIRWIPTLDGKKREPSQLGYDYRLADPVKWKAWLQSVSGQENPEVEVYKRTLRIKDPVSETLQIDKVPDPVKTVEPVIQKPALVSDSVDALAKNPVEIKILELVSEKTGYPMDMLNDDLDLEADLGIDTVKQAELFAEVRESYQIERDDSMQLSDFPTLRHIIQFVFDKRPDLKLAPPASLSIENVGQEAIEAVILDAPEKIESEVHTNVLRIISEKTGYPVDMLDPALDLEADLGIDTVKQAELFAEIRSLYNIERDDNLQLADFPTLEHIIQFVFDKRPDLKLVSSSVAETPSTQNVENKNESIPATGDVRIKLLELVAEKTGYPPEMLDLELDLEADLGIDTVKQAELFADIRETYGIEREDDLQLADFPTLGHILQFVLDRRPDLVPSGPVSLAPSTAGEISTPEPDEIKSAAIDDGVHAKVLSLIAEKTGYPAEMLDLDLDLEADLGIDTVKQAELFADIRETYGIERDDNLQLSEFPTLQHIIQFVYDRRPDLEKNQEKITKTIIPDAAPEPKPVSGEIQKPEKQDEIREKVLNLIAEKTGYPTEMLDLDLDLEADLGVDTVKQAELFTEVREAYEIERDDTLELAEFPTIQHIIQFVLDKRPDLQIGIEDPLPKVTVSASEDADSSVAGSQDKQGDDVQAKVLHLVSEKTGYPTEMLDLDLDLEADLGIDTVKQAELFAEIRAEYNIERDDTLELSEFPTLNHIIQFVYDRRPEETQGITADVDLPQVEILDKESGLGEEVLRRIPVPILRPVIGFCKSTGIEIDEERTLILVPDKKGIAASLATILEKSGARVHVLDISKGWKNTYKQLSRWIKEGPIDGVFWLPGLDNTGDLAALTYNQYKSITEGLIKQLFRTLKELNLHQENGPFLITGTRMGGVFGYDPEGAINPIGGAISGFTKAYKREFPDRTVKVVDFEKSNKTTTLAKILLEETRYDPAVVEVGYKDGFRWTIGIDKSARSEEKGGIPLNMDTSFLVTGAAGSIVSAITSDLAKASGGTFFLMDLIRIPESDDPDIQLYQNDQETLKRNIFERIKSSGDKPTPVKVDREIANIERHLSALQAIQSIEKAGGKVHYYQVNLLDNKAVAQAIKDIKAKTDHLDVFLHAGGLEISRLIKDKDAEEFDLVFDVKCDGWYNIMSSLKGFPVGAAVAFSSIAGRFGNSGQTDYSAANDFLCKSISNFKLTRPDTRGLAIDWTAWGEIGMAARGSIPEIMKQAGIGMLSPKAGVPFIREELSQKGITSEVVVANALGIMMKDFDQDGGIDLREDYGIAKTINERDGIMVQKVRHWTPNQGLVTEVSHDPKRQPFLYDHQINGIPVLPGVMGLEAMAEAATLLTPGLRIKEIAHVAFLAPFKFYRSEPRSVLVSVRHYLDDDEIIARCELFGERKLMGQEEAQRKIHFTADIRLTTENIETIWLDKVSVSRSAKQSVASQDDIYQVYFHGPAYQVLENSWKKNDFQMGQFRQALPPNHLPDGKNTLVHPRLIELCFQTAGVWEMGKMNRMGLPNSIDMLRVYGRPKNKRTQLFARIEPKDGRYNAVVVDKKGQIYLSVEGYTTAEFNSALDKELIKPLIKAVNS